MPAKKASSPQALKIDPEFQALVPPQSDAERAELEAQLLVAGRATDPLTVWRGVLVDGHNRYSLCTKHGLPYQTQELQAPDREAVKAWMLQHQIGRRNMRPDQVIMMYVLAGTEPPAQLMRAPGYTGSMLERARELHAAGATHVAHVVRIQQGKDSIQTAYRRAFPKPKPLPPLPAMAPEGHEVHSVSVKRDADGNIVGQWDKTRPESLEPTVDPVAQGHHVTKTATMFDAQGNVRMQWVASQPDKIAQEKSFWDACKEHTREYKGVALVTPEPTNTDAHTLTMYPLGDPHIGMLSWHEETGQNFDLKIAERSLLTVLTKLVACAPASHKAVLANVGDFFHADDDSQLTPGHGHKLDVDCRSGKVFRLGCALMRSMIDLLLQKHAQVDVRNVPGNHDPKTSRMLAMWLEAVYEKEPRVTIVPNLDPFSYLEFGQNLFGFTHGENVKADKLVGVMATDQKEAWGRTQHRLWVTGHVHHESRKEYAGCMVETYNTLAARDYWHHSKGYRSDRKLFAITFDETLGEVARSTVRLA